MAEYLTVAEAAALLGVSDRAIQKNALNGKYGELKHFAVPSRCRGGKQISIPLAALPMEAQERYISAKQPIAADEVKANVYDSAPEWQRQIADWRHTVIKCYHTHMAQHGNKSTLTEQFVEEWNAMHPKESISRSTLYNWLKEYKAKGIAGLLPGYGHRKEQRIISADAWRSFCEKYLQLSQPSVEWCYDLVALEAKEYGWTLPTVQTIYRMVQLDIPEAVKSYRRYGTKDYYDNIQTFTRRDPESISAGEVFVGDHHTFDLFILSGKKWVRPWLTAWMDMRSGKLVGWNINLSPCTDTIIAAFAEAALSPAIGLPRHIYIDNGRDYCSHKFAGRGNRGKKLTDEEKAALLEEGKRTATLMERLDIKTHFAIVENARAKNVERSFKTVVEWFSKMMPTYCGRNKNERPEDLGGKLKKQAQYGIELEEFRVLFSDWAVNVFNKKVSKSKGASPDQIFTQTRLPVRRAEKDVMQLFFMKSSNPFKIGRNGITYKGEEYHSKDFILRKGQRVYIRYRDEEPDKVWVYTTKDEYLGEAHRIKAVHAIAATEEDFAAEGKRKADELKAVMQHETFVAAKNAKPAAIGEIIELYKKHNDSAPDVEASKVIEPVHVSKAGRDAVRNMKATGTDDVNPFAAMLGSKIEKRKGGF